MMVYSRESLLDAKPVCSVQSMYKKAAYLYTKFDKTFFLKKICQKFFLSNFVFEVVFVCTEIITVFWRII